MTDHTERDIVIEDHFRRNSSRLVKNLSVKCKGLFNAEDSVHNAYERALRYWDSYEPDMGFDKWFEAVLRNAVSATMNEAIKMGGTTDQIEHYADETTARWSEKSEQIIDMIKDKQFNERNILMLKFVHMYSTRSEIPCLVPETEKQVRRIVEDFKAEVTARFGEPDTDE